MKISHRLSMLAAPAAALALAACSEPSTDTDSTGGGMRDMPGMQRPTASREQLHVAEGTVNSIEQNAGTINISHSPVASANWPAMTMSFKLADASAAANLTPGQRVEFAFTIESGMSATITEISPAD